jgi:hypothetical protein
MLIAPGGAKSVRVPSVIARLGFVTALFAVGCSSGSAEGSGAEPPGCCGQRGHGWVEGVDVPGLHVTHLAHENYDALRFGFEKYAGPASDIWYDDIAIGTQQLGCN